jgi:hypothetical protein
MQTNVMPNQKEYLAQKLKEIEPNVTSKDKADFVRENGSTRQTVYNYFKGDILNTDFALEMFDFFTKKINERAAAIKKIEETQTPIL